MGCDIHLFVEVRNREGQWEFVRDTETQYGDWGIGRTYLLFSRLAGVRRNPHDPLPISEPRGVPGDESPEVREYMDPDDGDLHSRSYLTLPELLATDWSPDLEWFRDDVLVRFARLAPPDDVRIVFAFDN